MVTAGIVVTPTPTLIVNRQLIWERVGENWNERWGEAVLTSESKLYIDPEGAEMVNANA